MWYLWFEIPVKRDAFMSSTRWQFLWNDVTDNSTSQTVVTIPTVFQQLMLYQGTNYRAGQIITSQITSICPDDFGARRWLSESCDIWHPRPMHPRPLYSSFVPECIRNRKSRWQAWVYLYNRGRVKTCLECLGSMASSVRSVVVWTPLLCSLSDEQVRGYRTTMLLILERDGISIDFWST